MKRKYYVLTTISTILLLFFIFLSESIEILSSIIDYIINYSNQLKNEIGWFATILSIIMYVKIRFFDTRMISKLQKAYGKQKFIESLEVILEMLDVYDPEEIMHKILMISEMETDMRKALTEIKSIINNVAINKPIIKLNRFESRKMGKEIKQLLKLIDKSMEIHYLAKDITLTNDEKVDQIGKMFESNIIKSKEKREKLSKYIERKKKAAKNSLLKDFNNLDV